MEMGTCTFAIGTYRAPGAGRKSGKGFQVTSRRGVAEACTCANRPPNVTHEGLRLEHHVIHPIGGPLAGE